MPKKTLIIECAEREAKTGKEYHWAPFSPGNGINLWVNDLIDADLIGQSADAPISCFEYPLMLCVQNKIISKKAMDNIIRDLCNTTKNKESHALSYWGYFLSVWTDWPSSKVNWRPRRGDIVFFNTPKHGDFNHAVLACGSTNKSGHAEVISFGEKLESPQKTKVTATTIEDLKQKGHSSVKFTQPVWA